jgi:hypothetical protein
MNLGTTSQNLKDLIFTRCDLMKNISSNEGASNTNLRTLVRANLKVRKNKSNLLVFSCLFEILIFYLVPNNFRYFTSDLPWFHFSIKRFIPSFSFTARQERKTKERNITKYLVHAPILQCYAIVSMPND